MVRPILVGAAIAAVLAGSGGTAAQQWPVKPVHLVVPFVPGGATDVLGRIYSDKLAQRFGQPVVIENKPGAGGNVGATYVARAPADGHVMFIASSPGFVNAAALSKDAGFDPLKDFVAVAMLATQPMLLNAHPSLAAGNIKELVAYAKANPGKLSYGTPGIGTPHHLAMELFKTVADIDVVHVPYRGGAPMTQDVVAGQVPLMFGSYVIAGPHLKAGRLKALGNSAKKRMTQAPEIPAIAEQGYPDFDVESWFGLVAPSGTPAAAIERMTREVHAVLGMDDVKDRLLKTGFDPPPLLATPAFAERLKVDVAKWSKVVVEAKIKPA